MATRHVTRKLQEQVTCPICMEFLQEPVTIDCGHNFCLQCISRVGDTSANVLQCPLCNCSVQRSTFRPNKLLANLVEEIQAMEPEEEGPEEEGSKCQQHREKIYYFCEDDGEFLCVVCRDSKNHKLHCALLLEEAAQKYKAQIDSQVQVLEQKENKTVQEIAEGRQMIEVFMAQVQAGREKIPEEFKVLRQSLEEEEHFLLSRLLWLKQEGAKQMQHYSTITEEQLNTLKEFKKSLVAKAHMPPRQLLENIKETLSRSEEFQSPGPIPVPKHLQKKINEAKSRHNGTMKRLRKLREDLQAEGEKDRRTFLKGMEDEDRRSFFFCKLKVKPESSTHEYEMDDESSEKSCSKQV